MQNGARWTETYYDGHFFPSRLIALFLLLFHFFSRFTTARARLCSSRRRLFPRCLPQGVWTRGDSDREIVGIRGVTRGDLVLVHNGSICLRSSCRTWASSNARGLLPVLFQTCPYPHRENTSRIFYLWDVLMGMRITNMQIIILCNNFPFIQFTRHVRRRANGGRSSATDNWREAWDDW